MSLEKSVKELCFDNGCCAIKVSETYYCGVSQYLDCERQTHKYKLRNMLYCSFWNNKEFKRVASKK